jgi:predicted nuclease of predicted toxin-antitoxin system
VVAEPIRFYMDQNFPGPASTGLRRHGIDVLTAQEAGRCGTTDREQLEFALAEERVLVSFDPDFLALHRSGISHAGIAWCAERKLSIGQLIQALQLVHGVLDRSSMKNHVEFL